MLEASPRKPPSSSKTLDLRRSPPISADLRRASSSMPAAMSPLSSYVAANIRFRFQELTDSNSEDIFRELCKLVDNYNEAGSLMLKICLEQMNLDVGDVQNLQLKCHVVASVFRYLMNRPNFSTVFCEAIRSTVMREGLLENLSNALKLSTAEKIGIGLALSESENLDFKMSGQNFCIAQLEILCVNSDSTLSTERIQEIFMILYHTEGLSELVDSFTKMLSLLHLKGSSLSMLFPMFTHEFKANSSIRNLELLDEYSESDFDAILEEIEKEMSMADTVRDLGYCCTNNTKHCSEILSQFLPLNEITISKLLGTISRTLTGLEDAQNNHSTFCSALDSSSAGDCSWANSWNADVLVDSIKHLAPKTNWIRVMENLDHEGFFLPDESAFSFLMSIYKIACQDPFPLHAICGSVWENAEGQLSFIRYAVTARPEVFTFEHSPRKLAYFDSVYQSNEIGNQAWFCIDLLEILCELAERGYATTVHMILECPFNQLPEVLLVGISQINTAYNLLQHEVSSTVFPIILKDSVKSHIIYHLWHINPNLVMRGFMDTCNADPNSLLKVVDICQELKLLSAVLESAPFLFSIKLAAIASQKDYQNLEKWLDDNMSTYKDAFFEACLGFLKFVLCDGGNDAPNSSFHCSSAAIVNNFRETCSIFLKVLQVHLGQVTSSHLIEEMKKLQDAFTPRIQSAVSTDSAKPDGNSDDIEAVANSYFHQMFSGELSVDAMIQMLARFKESPEKREQLIFECIVANLFEEYKFFPKYPDKQLKLAAVLFGSLIKHQLVTHLALGIALRGVLDALRKSVDSKMFVFGTKALEQFMDRLVEWPQYCNHILQISHLRGTHAELVSVIERALARISLSQSESSGSNTPPPDQQQVSLAPSGENLEVSESSWQLVGSSQPGQQLSSFQFQQRNQGLFDDRLKANAASLNFTKPLMTHAAQSSLLSPPIDSATSQKTTVLPSLQTSSSQYSATVASPGFLRPSRSITPAVMLRQPSYNTGFGAALNIETLVAAAERRETPIEAPSSEVQDKILFMINNISTANMDAKSKEFTEVLKEQYYPWFAQYMVMKRASIEPNFHDLYLKFLERVNSRLLNKEIVRATYENCKVLLRSDLIKSSSEERSLLKNLGSWLGKFTIGRNQALLAREIDPKVLIIEAYEKGLMIAVIPFTSKILEPCQYSLAYQPPNPWTMGILGLLTEIYNLPNLKMNLKFDIEVLFKNLGVDMKDVKPTSLLKDRVREVEGNPDFSNKDVSVAQPPVLAEVKSGGVPVMNQVEEGNNPSYPSGHPTLGSQYTTPLHLPSSTMVDDDKIGTLMIPERVSSGQGLTQVASSPSPFSLSQLQPLISNYDSYINVNPKLTSMGLQLQFQRIIQMSLDKAIREIVSPVIQRSVTIASRTTKEMVLKDLTMESDDGVILRSARMMVGALAGSLAHVTCKEPLRVALSNHLRNVLQALNVVTDIDQIVQNITTDNLDLGCAVIENVASVKAVELIDGEIAPAFASLRKHREATGSAYYDAGTYAQGPFARIPEALRPKPGHLSLAQMQVYKDFVRNTWQNQSSQSTNAMRAGLPGIAGDSTSSLPRVYGSNAGQASNNLYSSSQVAPGFGTMGQQLDTLPEEADRSSVHLLSVSSNQVGTSDSMVLHGAEVSSIMSSFPVAATAPELHMEASNVSKEMGMVVLPSPVTTVERLGTGLSESLLSTGDALDKYQLVAEKLENLIAKEPKDADIQGVVAEVPDIIRRCVSRDEAALAVAQKVFKSLYENTSNIHHINSHLSILSAIRDVCKLVVKELTSWVIYSDEERKFNTEITIGLIRSDLLNLAEYNVHLAKLIDGGRNKAALEFAVALVEALAVQESGVSMSELHNLIETLAKLAMRPGSPESLRQLVEICRNSGGNLTPQSDFTVSKEEKARQSKDRKVPSGRSSTTTEESSVSEPAAGDPAGFRDQVSQLFTDWCKISSLPASNDSVNSHYISQLQQLGLLKGDDSTDSFFRILTEISVAHCLAAEQAITTGSLSVQSTQQSPLITFTAIDAYAMLVVAILKSGPVDHGSSKIALLSKVLSVTVRVIQKDAEEKKSFFNPRPYFRLFINWLLDMASPDSVLDGANFQVLTSFANTFHALQPLKVPGWSFAWLELVSHRSFMPKLLMCNSPKGWPFVQRLLVDLFKFMEPYLRNAELGEPVHFLYKGTLRVLLVLLHDFPEFLCDYHFSFCDVIPPSCIQMRNVILSAFPRNMRLPDPSTPNLKIDLLAEISLSPRILSDVEGTLKSKQIKVDIDEYLKTRPDGSSFLAELKQRLLLPQIEANMAGTRYNVPLINSLVLYVGMQAIQQLQTKSLQQHAPTPQMTHNPPMDIFLVGAAMDIFQSLIKSLDTEGRYLFLNAVANQLRYPNNHTHYFSFVLLYLFAEASQDNIIQEQITRVLLERLIVNRPHPWGLLITFIELIKNPRYSFWSRPFTHCAPEIEKLFESVSRSCGGPKAIDDGIIAGGMPDVNH